jgi:hypothetical protein
VNFVALTYLLGELLGDFKEITFPYQWHSFDLVSSLVISNLEECHLTTQNKE